MRWIGVREARRCLPELMAAAEDGDVIVLTRHGVEVAALLPVEAADWWQRSRGFQLPYRNHVGVREVRGQFAEILGLARKRWIYITRRNKPVAVIITPKAASLWEEHMRVREAVERKYVPPVGQSDDRQQRQQVGELVLLWYDTVESNGNPVEDPGSWCEVATLVDLAWAGLTREQIAQVLADHRVRLLEAVSSRWSRQDPPTSRPRRTYGPRVGDAFIDQLQRHRLGVTRQTGAVVTTMDYLGRVRFHRPTPSRWSMPSKHRGLYSIRHR
ncbi:type II toxin-antitoxin system prevent-host-death family antitoxin [Streptomyces violaceus]|uniref:type II toxin-antitoxin system prevent-host-death family antitoxin n=1 Tax=Streptomyces violaceus TaxID=1936 RepID=UPI0037F78AD0